MLRPTNEGTERYVQGLLRPEPSRDRFPATASLGTLSRSEVVSARQDHHRVSIAALLVAV